MKRQKDKQQIIKSIENHEAWLEEVENELRMTIKLTNKNLIELLNRKISNGDMIIDVIRKTKNLVDTLKKDLDKFNNNINRV